MDMNIFKCTHAARIAAHSSDVCGTNHQISRIGGRNRRAFYIIVQELSSLVDDVSGGATGIES